jgi:hypothetical protein
MVGSVQLEAGRRRRRQDSEREILEAAERLLRERPFHLEGVSRGLVKGFVDATFGRVGASDDDRSAAPEPRFTIWMRTLYGPDPLPRT